MRILRGTIATRLILALIGSGMLLIIASTAIRFAYDYDRGLRLLDKRVSEVKRSSVPALVSSVWLADWDMVRVEAKGIAKLPEILRVQVVAADRNIAIFGPKPPASALPRIFPLIKHYKGEALRIGTLTLFPDKNAVRQRLLGALPVEIGIPLFAILIISSLLYFLFYRLAGRHLAAIASQLRSLGQAPMAAPLVLDKPQRPGAERDEIDQVIYSFNEMQQQLRRFFAELRQTNDELSREIQGRIRVEEELRENRAMLRDILDTVPQAIFWKDRQGVYLGCNQVFGAAAGLHDPEDIVGKSDFDLPWPKAKAESYQAGDREVIDTKKSKWHIVEPLQRADGHRLWIDKTKIPLLDDADNAYGVLGVYEDISERIHAEEEKSKLQTQLNHAMKMEAIGVLAGGIAHDFNNILAAIMGSAELARYKTLEDSAPAHYLDNILTAVGRAKDLVAQILTFSRQTVSERIPLRLQPLVKESLKMLRASIPTTIIIKDDIDPQAGVVVADPSQMHQLIMNLCTNAFQAMEAAGGTLAVEVKAVDIDSPTQARGLQLEQGKYVQLSVRDTGVGIAPEIMGRIFDPYFTTKEVGKGTGMGLSISHGIVKSHGGTITVESALGSGTTFRVLLPMVEDELQPESITQESPGGNERVLLVDDEEIVVEMARDMLERLGYQVTTLCGGSEALETFSSDPDRFDLVITDQTMHGMTGVELSRKLLQIRPDIPIILCTGFSSLIDEESAKAMGIRGFAMKPFTLATLAQSVRRALADRSGAGDAIG